jgi:hypothetical protein
MSIGGKMSIVKQFTTQIKATEFPKMDRKQLAASGLHQGMATTLKKMGQTVHGLDGINIWGKEKDSSEKMPDFKNARFGCADGASAETRSLLEVLGVETKSGGQVGFTQTMVLGCESDWAFQHSQRPVVKLTNEALDSLNFTGPLAIGYGDATGAGYGAGPTRDLRRAYLLPRLVAVVPEMEIMKKNPLGGKTVSPAILNLIANLEAAYTVSYSGSGSHLKLEKGGDSYDVVICPFNLSTKKAGLGASFMGDLLITITAPKWTSGQDFLPDEVKNTSPMFGSLNYFLGDNVSGDVQLKAKAWIEGEIAKYSEIANKVLPAGLKINQAGAVFIENS